MLRIFGSTSNESVVVIDPETLVESAIGPMPAAVGTVALIVWSSTTLKPVATPSNLSELTPRRLVPLTVTTVPTLPCIGSKDDTNGETFSVVGVVKLPLVVVTVSRFVAAHAVSAPLGRTPQSGSVNETCVELSGVIVSGSVPSFRITPGSFRFVPFTSTVEPTLPAAVNDVIFGVTFRVAADRAPVPPAVVETVSLPLVALVGTFATSLFGDTTVGARKSAPVKCTALVPSKPEPLIVTAVPIGPLPGENDVIFGVTAKLSGLSAAPPAVSTWIFPVVALVGIVNFSASAFRIWKPVETPLTRTDLRPPKAKPLTVTWVPVVPLAGLNPVIFGPTMK